MKKLNKETKGKSKIEDVLKQTSTNFSINRVIKVELKRNDILKIIELISTLYKILLRDSKKKLNFDEYRIDIKGFDNSFMEELIMNMKVDCIGRKDKQLELINHLKNNLKKIKKNDLDSSVDLYLSKKEILYIIADLKQDSELLNEMIVFTKDMNGTEIGNFKQTEEITTEEIKKYNERIEYDLNLISYFNKLI
jgi:hypothetical protein